MLTVFTKKRLSRPNFEMAQGTSWQCKQQATYKKKLLMHIYTYIFITKIYNFRYLLIISNNEKYITIQLK